MGVGVVGLAEMDGIVAGVDEEFAGDAAGSVLLSLLAEGWDDIASGSDEDVGDGYHARCCNELVQRQKQGLLPMRAIN